MTNKDLKEGMVVSFENLGYFFKDWILHKDGIKWYAYPDNEFEEWTMRVAVDNDTHIQPKQRTIDDLECGDYVVRLSHKSKCLGKHGEVYDLSYPNHVARKDDWDKTYFISLTLWELKQQGFTLYQPTEEKEADSVIDKLDDCVKTFFSQADDLINKLKK